MQGSRKATEDMMHEIQTMKQDLAALNEDDDVDGGRADVAMPGMPAMRHQQSHSVIPDTYEHHHDPNQEEFRLIPDVTDKAQAWKRYIPIVYWLPRYNWKEWFPMDIVATVTDIVMVIPQAMGYALVAGLPPINGLYSALMGHCLYSPFGTSGQLIVAPVAIVSLMTKETLHALPIFHDADYEDEEVMTKMAGYGSALAFQSGVLCIILGLCKAGTLANMLAEPVITGFTFGAAILIGISQLTFIFNIHVHGESVIQKLTVFFQEVSHSHGGSVVLALVCACFLLFHKYYGKSSFPLSQYFKYIPVALILVVVCTTISAVNGDSTGWDVVGALPPGLPKPVNFFTYLEEGDFWALWVPSILITILSFIESIAVAQKFADKHDYSIDASQELLALGICNLIGSWFQIYPVSGVLSLATVVEAAGATTPLYGIMAGTGLIIVTASVLFLFEWLPKPVLGAIVCVGIMGLMDPGKIKKIYGLNKRDFIIVMVTIGSTLFLGIDFGVAFGVFASIVLFIQRAAKPHYSILGRVVDSSISEKTAPIYRSVKLYPSNTEPRSDMLMIRWDAPLFFANTASFKSRIKKHIGRFLEKNEYPKQWCLVLDFSGVNDVDFTALEMMHAFIAELKEKERGMTLVVCKLKTQVLNALTKGEILSEHLLPKENVLWELHEAEKWWDEKMALMGDAENYYDDDQSNRHLMANTDQMMGYAGTHVVNGIQTDDDEYVDDELVTMR